MIILYVIALNATNLYLFVFIPKITPMYDINEKNTAIRKKIDKNKNRTQYSFPSGEKNKL
jgi:hypothetical protein